MTFPKFLQGHVIRATSGKYCLVHNLAILSRYNKSVDKMKVISSGQYCLVR